VISSGLKTTGVIMDTMIAEETEAAAEVVTNSYSFSRKRLGPFLKKAPFSNEKGAFLC